MNVRSLTTPRSSSRTTFAAITAHAATGSSGIPSTRAKSLPRPPGSTPSTPLECFSAPATALIRPSPPSVAVISPAAVAATGQLARRARGCGFARPCARCRDGRARAWTSGSARPARPPPADGLTTRQTFTRRRVGSGGRRRSGPAPGRLPPAPAPGRPRRSARSPHRGPPQRLRRGRTSSLSPTTSVRPPPRRSSAVRKIWGCGLPTAIAVCWVAYSSAATIAPVPGGDPVIGRERPVAAGGDHVGAPEHGLDRIA